MTMANDFMLLSRMEAARRQTRVHLDLVDRQNEGRAERSTVTARVKGRPFGRGGPAWTPGDERLFREHLERLAFARRIEIEALSRKLARQDRAIAALRSRLRIETICAA
ncbi:hypothetical protein [Aminobacter sp. MSH1]|uniref:hypothetical protein n=1 Tax=Aminobacter sp. MSH1 TaxID=374606 RepID=UPI000D3492CE|nr:hypothetical protein [Aminobacter sp. MSH1]